MSKHGNHADSDTDDVRRSESGHADPVFPTQSEYQVDEGGPQGSRSKHPGLIWILIAVVAVVGSCIVFALVGDWDTPQEAQQINDQITNYEIHP